MIDEQYLFNLYKTLKKKLFLAMFIVGILIIAFIIHKSGGLAAFLATLASIPLVFILAAMGVRLITSIANSIRYRMLVGLDLGFYDVFKIDTYGFVLNYGSPVQGVGLGSRIGMYKLKGVSVARSTAGITSEILYDCLFNFIFIIIYVIWKFDLILKYLRPYMSPYLLIPLVLIVLFLLFVFFYSIKADFFIRYKAHLKNAFTLKKFLIGMLLTFIAWMCISFMGYLMFKGMGFEVDIWLLLFSSSVALFIGMIGFVPGGLGIRDGVRATIYTVAGLSFAVAAAISIGMRLLSILNGIIIFLIFSVYEFVTGRKKSKIS